MTSRRIISAEKSLLDKDDGKGPGATPAQGSDVAPAVPMSVIAKLLGFALAMVVAPLGTYFLTLNALFKGNPTFAGASAAIMANVVLVAYVIVAFREDESERLEAERMSRKEQ